MKMQGNQEELQVNGTHQLLVWADDNLLCENIYHKEKFTTLTEAKEVQ
jgi:hypothetical protein